MSPMIQPTLTTTRLVLRPFSLDDASQVLNLAGNKLIADTTSSIPHPYPEGAAEVWIETLDPDWEMREKATFAIQAKDTGALIGAISLMNFQRNSAEIGYWVGVPYWGNGFCTEAVSGLMVWAFAGLNLKSLTAYHLQSNPASGKVLQKCGFHRTAEGTQTPWKNGATLPVNSYEITRSITD
jgi:ribosomal-protein-alanine N-acetyltransferase